MYEYVSAAMKTDAKDKWEYEMVCCFFGHKDAPASIAPSLETVVEYMIRERNADEFLVGNQGNFDSMVYRVLKKVNIVYPHITYHVVLAYMPKENTVRQFYEYGETLLPEGIENVPPKFAISLRNKWMVREADICICYVKHSWGGAAQYMEYAKKHAKEVVNLYKDNYTKK